MRMQTDELYVKSEAEMRALFPQLPEAIDNTDEDRRALPCGIRFRRTCTCPIIRA